MKRALVDRAQLLQEVAAHGKYAPLYRHLTPEIADRLRCASELIGGLISARAGLPVRIIGSEA